MFLAKRRGMLCWIRSIALDKTEHCSRLNRALLHRFRNNALDGIRLPALEVVGWDALEDGAEAGGIEFRRAVEAVDAVLLLLNVGDLGIAEADYVLGSLQSVDLLFEKVVEFLDGIDVFTVSPRVGPLFLRYPG